MLLLLGFFVGLFFIGLFCCFFARDIFVLALVLLFYYYYYYYYDYDYYYFVVVDGGGGNDADYETSMHYSQITARGHTQIIRTHRCLTSSYVPTT